MSREINSKTLEKYVRGIANKFGKKDFVSVYIWIHEDVIKLETDNINLRYTRKKCI